MCVLLQRMDLGECPKVHDLALRADYEIASKTKDYFYDIDVSIETSLFTLNFTILFEHQVFRNSSSF